VFVMPQGKVSVAWQGCQWRCRDNYH